MNQALVTVDGAMRALAAANTPEELIDLASKAEAMRRYAQKAKLGLAAMNRCAWVKISAERKLGILLGTIELHKGGRPTETGCSAQPVFAPKLKELGIEKTQAHRCQRIASLSDQEFERYLAEAEEITTADILRLAKTAAKEEGSEAHRQAIEGGRVDDLLAFIAAGHRCGTVYLDPPWLYDNQVTRAATSNHYEGLTVEQLCALPVGELAAPDAHLHLWTTNGFLFECPRLFAAWGFEFKSSFVWAKPQIGIGNYWRNSHEFLLTAVRGDATRFADKSLKSWLECDRGPHSEKPEMVRTFIERASPAPRIELFARLVAGNDWLAWGHQVGQSLLSQGARKVA